MNYLTNMKNVQKLSQQELHNIGKSSWHDQYKDSAWIFIGGLPFDLTEGDIICVFSQYGEVVNINLIREKDTGKSKGFCFLCYEDQRSTILAVDNFNGMKIMKRTIRVDHVQDYKVPKDDKKATEETKKLYSEGCAPKVVAPVIIPKVESSRENLRETLADQIEGTMRLPARLPIYTNIKSEKTSDSETTLKIEKDKKKSKKKSRKSNDSSGDSSSSESVVKIKKEKRDNDFGDRRRRSEEKDKYSNRYSKSSSSSHSKSENKKRRKFGSPKRRTDRSRSKDVDDEEKKTYKRGVSPSIPKRWR